MHYDIEKKLRYHFSHILMEPIGDDRVMIQLITFSIPNLVSLEKNEILIHSVSFDEVSQIVMDMDFNKSLGPDGFTMQFFQRC